LCQKKKEKNAQIQDELIALRKKVVELENALVTAQKKQEKLRQSEEKYSAIFESFYDVYYRTDRDGKVIDISPSIQSQAGYEPKEVISHPINKGEEL
jgi:PAS domain-containing protein